ncbi:hypothetical protein ABKN59_008845 [Abortiporus biennis]
MVCLGNSENKAVCDAANIFQQERTVPTVRTIKSGSCERFNTRISSLCFLHTSVVHVSSGADKYRYSQALNSLAVIKGHQLPVF